MRAQSKHMQTTSSAENESDLKSRSVLVLDLIGWEGGASFLNQSQNVVK